MTTGFVRIPPDSTGKKISSTERRVLYYDQLTGNFEVGQTVTGISSGASGVITGKETLGFSANKGILYLAENTGTWVDNEDIQVSAVTVAVVNIADTEGGSTEDLYIQNNIIADANSPDHQLRIDSDGGAHINFNGKTPFVESQGELITTHRTMAWTPTFDYTFDDPNLSNNEYRLAIASKTWPTLPTSGAGTRVFGETSGATGRMCAFPSAFGGVDMVYMTDCIGEFTGGEVIRAAEDPRGHFFTLAGTTVPVIEINSTTKSLDIRLPSSGLVDYQHAIRTSNLYIPQARQETTTIAFSASAGGLSENGITRRLGLFDDKNGVFMEIVKSDGTDTAYDPTGGFDTSGLPQFAVVHRTNTSGSVVDHRVFQSDFNVNKLDGSDANGFIADFTNLSRVWIDWPGGGAGTIEFGVYNNNGDRITAHRIQLTNSTTFIVNATDGHKLPVRGEVFTNGGGTPSTEVSIKLSESAVLRSIPVGDDDFQTLFHGASQSYQQNLFSSRGEVPLLSVRARKTFNGVSNRMFSRMHDLNVNLVDSRTSRQFSNSAINDGNDTIALTNHGFSDGDSVFFKQGNNSISGLTDWGLYYVVAEDDNTIKLANTYHNSVNTTPSVIAISPGEGTNHQLDEPDGGSALVRLRINSAIADSTWSPHNTDRSGTEVMSANGTGFRLSPFITVSSGGTGYTVGDMLELDSQINHVREAVLEVTAVSTGVITEVRIANNSVGHLTEVDGTTTANYGSYNGKIASPVGHKINGLTSTTGDNLATFNVNVEWGHGFWWAEVYGDWSHFDFSRLGEMFPDFSFFLSESEHIQGNITITGETRATKNHNAKIIASTNWTEIL